MFAETKADRERMIHLADAATHLRAAEAALRRAGQRQDAQIVHAALVTTERQLRLAKQRVEGTEFALLDLAVKEAMVRALTHHPQIKGLVRQVVAEQS
jgi:hypothetical protein